MANRLLINHTLNPDEAFLDHAEGQEKFDDFTDNGVNYAARAAVISYPEDVIQIHPKLAYHHALATEYLGALGIETAKTVLHDTSLAAGHDLFPDHQVSTYAFDEQTHSVVPNEKRLKITKQFDHKTDFMELSLEKGWAVPYSIIVKPENKLNLDLVRYPSFAKPDVTSNGVGRHQVENEAELLAAVPLMGEPYLVQQAVAEVASFSVQYRVTDGKLEHLATTNQLVNPDGTHKGNVFPATANIDPRSVTDVIAKYGADSSLEDVFAFDVLLDKDGQLYVIECNARYTGATYPTITARRLGLTAWTSRVLPTTLNGPEDLELDGLSYDVSTKSGVIITNNARYKSHGKVEAVLAGPADTHEEMLRDFTRILNPRAIRAAKAKRAKLAAPAAPEITEAAA